MRDALVHLAASAAREVMGVYRRTFDVKTKADATPLTEADLRAHRTIVEGLRQLAPDVPVISEEDDPPPLKERRRWHRHWLVDPLDGTRDFVARNGQFAVNIALVENGSPILGVVAAPARGEVYVGDCVRKEAWLIGDGTRHRLHTRAMNPDRPLAVVASRRHGIEPLARYFDKLRDSFGNIARLSVGSSLKFCLLAEGKADLHPRLSPTSQWDTAAPHAVLQAAGGAVLRTDGRPLRYEAEESFLNPSFLAVADPSFPWWNYLPE